MATRDSGSYRPRLVDPLLDELLAELPALMMVGARATGKTTSAEIRAASIVRLDRPAEAVAFTADPDAALRDLAAPVLLDEWQAVPALLGAVKRAVDSDPTPGRFLLTGSVRAQLDNEVWPGTGRLVRIAMFPMTMREQLERLEAPAFFDRLLAGDELTQPQNPPDLRGYVELALRGGFPAPALRLGDRAAAIWLDSYLDDLLTHDIAEIDEGGRDPQRLRRYFEAYALMSGTVADHKTVYEAAGVNKATGRAYEKLLEDLLVTEAVPAWRSNRLKRLVHQPKRFVVDPALAAAALRLDVGGMMRDGTVLGRLLETFVAAQLRPEPSMSAGRARLHHLRTMQGRHEIDLLAEMPGGRLIGVEVKAGAAPSLADAKHLAWLRDELGDRFEAGVVLHTGPRIYELGERILAAPICVLWA